MVEIINLIEFHNSVIHKINYVKSLILSCFLSEFHSWKLTTTNLNTLSNFYIHLLTHLSNLSKDELIYQWYTYFFETHNTFDYVIDFPKQLVKLSINCQPSIARVSCTIQGDKPKNRSICSQQVLANMFLICSSSSWSSLQAVNKIESKDVNFL